MAIYINELFVHDDYEQQLSKDHPVLWKYLKDLERDLNEADTQFHKARHTLNQLSQKAIRVKALVEYLTSAESLGVTLDFSNLK